VRRLSAALLLALAVDASAGKKKHDVAPPDAHPALSEQLTAESQTLTKTITTVADKLAAADALRLRRLRAATRLLHAPLPENASADDRLAFARRHAAARLLLDRDAAERALLADEIDHLRAADTRVTLETGQVAGLHLPVELSWPAKGTVSRRFGPFVHEHSKAELSRRGLDLDVEEAANVIAPADGIVRYSGPIRGLDHGVILDHGDYMTVIAKLGDAMVPVGAKVARGDRVGHAARKRLYFELRAKVGPGGLPIDPEPYLR
jgi:septal ring factor EnvC (AmiA/AmiB activator)